MRRKVPAVILIILLILILLNAVNHFNDWSGIRWNNQLQKKWIVTSADSIPTKAVTTYKFIVDDILTNQLKKKKIVASADSIPTNQLKKKWIVTSADHIPTKAVTTYKFIVGGSDWSCVIVLKKKSIEKEFNRLKHPKFVVLTLEDQAKFVTKLMSNTGIKLSDSLNTTLIHNIGYLYAIAHGAQVIYDTSEYSRLAVPSIKLFEQISDYVLLSKRDNLLKSYKDVLTTAPPFLWIYGHTQPLTWMGDYLFLKEMQYDCPDFKKENVKIIQFFQDKKTELAKKEIADMRMNFALSRGTFAVYDSESVLHDHTAFFGVFRSNKLQYKTVEILRSLYTQRLLCDLGCNIAFAKGSLQYNADGTEEGYDGKLQTSIIEFLLSWRSDAPTLVERMIELANKFYEREYWSEDEAYSIQIWIVALANAGYTFPPITRNDGCASQIESCELAKHNSDNTHQTDSDGVSLVWMLRMTSNPEKKWPLSLFYKQIFIRSMKFFWHQENSPIDLAVILDSERKGDHTFGEEIQKEYPYPKVFYEVDEKTYGSKQTNRMQWSMFWADRYTTKEYVGFIDTDSIFVSLVTDDMFFQDGRPSVHGFYGTSFFSSFARMKVGTYMFLGLKQVFKAMNYFPVIIKTKHLVQLREYIENLHGSPFDDVFRKVIGKELVSQFSIMMNYCWYFHRDEYVWFMEESQKTSNEANELTSFPEITEEMKVPYPKLMSHYKYFRNTVNVAKGWNIWGGVNGVDDVSLKTRNKVMLEGYCFSGGFSLTPDKCTDFNQSEVRVVMFDFEFHSWLWDDRCLTSQRDHYSRTSGLKHEWDLSLLT